VLWKPSKGVLRDWRRGGIEAEEVEGSVLERRGDGELLEGRQVTLGLDGVPGEGGQVIEQAAEATHGVAFGGLLRLRLGLGTA